MSSGLVSRCAALSWARSRALSPQRLWPVLRARGGVEALLAAGEDELAAEFKSRDVARAVLRGPHDAEALRAAASLERSGVRVLTAFDEEYPAALREISDPPFVLHAVGRLERLRLPAVAIVGSRDASRYGNDVARRMAGELSAAGVTVVSGFARGVDAAAHEAALEGPGGTIAVLGCGVDVDYPARAPAPEGAARHGPPPALRVAAGHRAEAAELSHPQPHHRRPLRRGRRRRGVPEVGLADHGAPGQRLRPRRLRRSGLGFLADLGRLPRAPARRRDPLPRRRGRARGALPVGRSSAAPVRRGIAPSLELSPEARRVFDALCREEGLSAEDLARALDLPAATVLASLFELEGAGFAVPAPGGRYGAVRR